MEPNNMASSRISTSASVPSHVLPTSAVDFVNKVKLRYESQPAVYESFLSIFKKFQDQQCSSKHMPFVDKRNAENEIYFEALTLFEDSGDLAEEFRNYMMSGDGPDSGDFLGSRRLTRNKSSAATTPITISTSKRRASTKPSTSDDVSHRAAPSSTFAHTNQLSVQKRGDFIKPTIPSTPKYLQSPRSSTLTPRTQRQIPSTPKRPESKGSTTTASRNTTPRSAHSSSSSFRNPSTSAHIQSKSDTTDCDVLSTILAGTVYTPTQKSSTPFSTPNKDSSTLKARESKEHTPSRVLLSKSGTITQMSSAPKPFESSSSEGTAQFPNPSTTVTKPQTFPTPNSSVYGSVNPRPITGPKVSTAQPLSHSNHPYKSASSSKQKGRGSIKSATARSKRASTLKPTIPQLNPLHPFNPSKNMYASENPLSIGGQKVPTTQKFPLSAKSNKSDSSSNKERVESVPTNPIKSDTKRKRKSSTPSQSSKRACRTSDGSTGGNERPISGDKRSSANSSIPAASTTTQADNLPYSAMNISSINKSSTQSVQHVPAQSLSFQTNMFGPNYEQMSSDSLLVILANVSEFHGNLINRSIDSSESSTFKFTENPQIIASSLDRSHSDMNISSDSNFLTQMESTFDNSPSSRRSSFSTFTASPPSHSLSESDMNSGSNSPTQSLEHVPAQSLSFQTNLFYDEMSSDSSLALLANVSEVYRNLINHSMTPSGNSSFKAAENPQIASLNADLIVIDHTELERVGPSYLKFSNNDKSSGRNVLGDRVLNDTLSVCCADDFQIKEIEHDTSVHELFRIENERANLDHVIETTRSTMDHLNVILAQVRKMFKKDSVQLVNFMLDENLNGRSGVIYRQAIRRIYGEEHFARIYLDLRTLPMQIIPRVLRRLGEKLDEWKKAQKDFFKNWRKQTEAVYLKSLDVRGVTFREEDSKLLQRESLLREMKDMFQRGQANGGAPIQLIKEYPLEYFIEVASELIMYYVRKHDSFQLRQEQEIDVMLSQYIPDLLLKRKNQTEESKIFHANDNWFYFFRLYILLCERLRHMQNVVLELVQSENDELEQQKEKCANSGIPFIPKENEGVPTSDYLICLVVLVRMKLDKKLTVEEYKNELRDKFGNKAYTAYSLDLIVHNIVVELLQLANERNPVNCRSLFDLSQEAISAASYSVDFMKQKVDLYEQCAKHMITADHVIKIVFDKVNGRVSFEYKHNPTHPYIPRQ